MFQLKTDVMMSTLVQSWITKPVLTIVLKVNNDFSTRIRDGKC